MTIYSSRLRFENGEPSWETDPVPGHVTEVWEVAGGHRWCRHPEDPDVWVPDGEDEPSELLWFELLRDFYAVTDVRAEALVLTGGES